MSMWKKSMGVKGSAVGVFALMLLGALLTSAYAQPGGSGQGIGALATNVKGSLQYIEQLIVAACYVAGIAFAGAAIMKFKQYKDNPQSGTLGQPIALIFIAAALVWLPQIITSAGQTVFNSTSGAGSTTANVQVIQ